MTLDRSMGPSASGPERSDTVERLDDQAARDAIRTELDETAFVEAAAGTGKTTALVGRIIEVLRRGRGTLEDIVAVTFTEKAAGEMKLRLRSEIEAELQRSRADDDDGAGAAHLERALEQLELAHIGTIHGFCADLLKERPVEAGVDPGFEVAAEDEASRLLDRAFEAWFEETLSAPGPGVRRALRRYYSRNSGGPGGALRRAASELVEHRDFPAAWTRPEFDREAEIDRAVNVIRELGDLAGRAARPDDYLTRNLEHLHRWTREVDLREEARGREYDYLEAQLRSIVRSSRTGWHWRGFPGHDFGEGLDKRQVIARRDVAKAELDEIVARADADLAALLREELRPIVARYEEIKRREGRLDFVDLLLRTRDLLRDRGEIRARFRERFTHFFVDEFQDTDPLQVEILLLLTSDDPDETDPTALVPVRGKLFVVGDPKQSIYRFRRADVMLYERTKDRLEAAGAQVLHLTTSFRSQPRIQSALNAAFERRMTGSEDGSQAEYVALAPFRPDLSDQPAVIALPVPRPYGRYGSVYKRAIEDSLPDAVGALVRWIVEDSGWRVTEREYPDRLVPVEARHVCLLFRRFQSWGADVTRPYVRALEARTIPHVLVGGRSYFDREEVLAVRNALTAIEWPDDRLSVYAALRGPLFSLGDATLFAFHDLAGSIHPLRPFGRFDTLDSLLRAAAEAGYTEDLAAVAEALEILGALHRRRNRRPIPETIHALLARVRAHAGIAIWPTGEQALANVLRVVDQARAFERTGAPSFRAFLDRLEEDAERGQAEEAPIVEEGTEGVRMMTVHKAKGLEFPVVILADITCNATSEIPSRYVDAERGLWARPLCGAAPLDLLENVDVERRRERAESDRLAYVASTRARDLLVVPAVSEGREPPALDADASEAVARASDDEEPEWWLDALAPALYPPRDRRRSPGDASGFGVPAFGLDCVIERFGRDGAPMPRPADSVAPGVHTAVGGNPLVWWDPATLGLGTDAPTAARQQRLLEVEGEEQPTLSVEEGIAAHDAWQARRARTLAAGREASIRLAPAKRLAALAAEAGEPRPGQIEVDWIEVPRPDTEGAAGSGRPGGDRFGNLVHLVLASTALDIVQRESIRGVVDVYAAQLGAPPLEARFAVELVHRALSHPLLRRAVAAGAGDAGAVRREVPFLHRRSGGDVVEGVIDLAFREPEGWTVVDYKTDRRIEAARAIYEGQVARYARAIMAASGEPARGVVLVL